MFRRHSLDLLFNLSWGYNWASGRVIAEIAHLTFFAEDTVLYWFDRYKAENLQGLEDCPR